MFNNNIDKYPFNINGIRPINVKQRGFTLVEILVALFIFSIVSMMLVGALRSVISTQSRTDIAAAKLAQLQMALLITSRDLQQTVDRPITDAQGHQGQAFVGSSTEFTFTHMGYALQRTGYTWHDNCFWRLSWPSVDQAAGVTAHERLLVSNVTNVMFEYLDAEGHFQHDWPSHASHAAVIPRAVKVTLTIDNWGQVSQVYVVPSGETKNMNTASPSSLSMPASDNSSTESAE